MASRSSGLSPQDEITQGRELGWDVIAFHPAEDPNKEKNDSRRKAVEQRNHVRANFVWRLKQIGLIVVKQRSSDRSDIIYKIAAPTHVLEPHAETIGMEMKSKFVDPKSGRNLYREFSREEKSDFLGQGPRFFTSLERSRLIFSLIEESIEKGGAGINLDRLQNEEKALEIFPLHDQEVKEALANKWLAWNKIDSVLAYSWELIKDFYRLQPLDDIRDYFGEKFALYFAWLDWYNLFLKPLSILGLLIFLVQMGYGLDYSNVATVIYAVVLCLWCTLFCESWKRRESTLAFYWDVQDFEEEERVRPEFIGSKKPGVYTESGQWVDLSYKINEGVEVIKVPHNTYFNPWLRFSRVAASLSVLAVFLFALVVGTFAILAFRVFVQAADRAGAIGGGILAGILNAVFIIIMNQIYNKIALDMNNWENHRTDTAFEDRLIAKQFSFKFVNSYASLAFIAFAKNEPIPSWLSALPVSQWPEEFATPRKIFGMDIGRCKGVSCMSELFTQLMTLQITMIFVSNITEIVIPFIKKKLKVRQEQKGARATTSTRTTVQPVNDEPIADGSELAYFELEMSSPTHGGVLEEYTEMMIQFGYVTLFACAFPLSSLCALLNNIIEIKVDGFKLLYATRRPKYQGAEDIGTWQSVLEFMSLVSVISNCAIICFTSGVFKGNVVDRESSKYANCALKCDTLYGANTQQELASFNQFNWTQVAYLGDRLSDYSRCLTGCSCESPIGTCYQLSARIWIFVVSEHIILGTKLLLAYLIPDKPAWVEEAEARAAVEKDLKHWDPSHKHELDETALKSWEEGEDNTDVWDNEIQRTAHSGQMF